MDWGEPHKGLYARRVAAALAYIGLCNYDRVSLYAYADTLRHELPGVRGRRLMHRIISFLQETPYEGSNHLAVAAKTFAVRHPQRGVLIIVSDFFDKGGFETGLRYLLGRNLDVYAVQVLAPGEIDPTFAGDLRLRDVEDADVAEVTISRALVNRYKQNLQAYCQSLREFCTRRGICYLFTSTEVPFDQLVLNYLRRRGLLQ